MAEFTLGGVTYPLVGLDQVEDLTLGELETLEDVGGLRITEMSDVAVTSKLVLALVLVSMRRVDPAATPEMARGVKVSVLHDLAGEIANSDGDAVPPTVPDVSGVPA